MRFVKATAQRFAIIGELVAYLWTNQRRWMLPIMVVLFVFGTLLILAQSSAIAPFIYTLF